MKTIIMAGGKGTRISELFPRIPKPLIPISTISLGNGNKIEKPVLQWEIESLASQGFTDIILTVSHMADQIISYFTDGRNLGVHIQYYIEETPLGNAGALLKLRSELGDEPFLLLNADAVFDVNFKRMIEYHKKKLALVTLFTHPNSHPYDSGLIITGDDGSVLDWLTKEDPRPDYYKNRVNAGLHIIDPAVLDMAAHSTGLKPELIGTTDTETGRTIKVDLDRQVLKPLCGTGMMYSYDSPEYVKDMGTPERYKLVSNDFQNGIVAAKNLSNKQNAIFLDRDGTINKFVGFLRNIGEFELLPGAAEAIKLINESGYLAVVCTNQPVVARGEVTVAQLQEIHNKMETLLGQKGAYIDGIYYCPHHPHKGYAGEIPELKIDCDCRKPKPGLLINAAEDFNINLEESWMVGDGENDIKAGKNAGCKTALIGDGEFGQDITGENLLEIIQKILG